MKILRLELQGFKSFKDKTIIHFDQPITAIVGSNGCGKSNVVDALYWVMGDMSPKHLRGSQMTDVIFSGTKTTTAMDMAEVTLVMGRDSETDPTLPPQFQTMDEIQITRRYYRHGESEYFINRVTCRLRDIQEFFMDTGIGAKSYSIIEQGAITRMVAQKPEERRLVIEDVAGITKFKARRAETERKLEQSNLNLQRIDDLVKDMQKQLATLQRQAEKAQKYKEWTEELKELEIRVAGKEWTTRRDRLNQSKDDTKLASEKLTELETSLASSKEELQKCRELLESSDSDLSQMRSTRQSHELFVKERLGSLQALHSKEETLTKRNESDQRIFVELGSRSQVLETQITEIATKLANTEAEAASYIQRIEEARSGIDKIRFEVEELRKNQEDYQRELHLQELSITKLSQEIQSDQKQNVSLEDRQSVIEELRVDIERELNVKSQERSGAEQLLQEAFTERKDLEEQKSSIDNRIQNFEVALAASSDKLLKSQETLTRDQLRLQHLSDLQKNLEGIGAASKNFTLYLKDKGIFSPLIADQIRVPQLLERAVESAFGELLETVVLKSSADAEDLMRHLQETSDVEAKASRVKFFIEDYIRLEKASDSPTSADPISTVTQGSFDSTTPESISYIPEAPGPDNVVSFATETVRAPMTLDRYLREHPKVVGRLDELMKDESSVIPLWASSFKNWWVVRDRTAFELLRPSLNSDQVLVSLDGDLCYPNGFVDYAPLAENPNSSTHLVQRKRELEELTIKVSEYTQIVQGFLTEVEETKRSLQVEREAYKLLTQRLVALNPGLQKHTDLIRDLEAHVARLTEKKEGLTREFTVNAEKLENLRVSLQEKNESLLSRSQERNETQAAFEKAHSQLSEVQVQYKSQSSQLDVMQAEYNAVLKKLSFEKTEQATYLQERNSITLRIQQLEIDLKEIEVALEQITVSRGEIAAEVRVLEEKLSEYVEVESRLETQTKDQKKQVTSLETSVSTFQVDLQKEFERLKNLEQDTAVNEVEIRNIEDRIASSYQLRLAELPGEELQKILAPSDLEEDINPELNKEKVERLKGKVDRLGKINMVAMEEYQDLGKRYEYLYVQKQDLADAIKSLYDAIERIDQESRQRFEESFTAVNEAFRKTFPIMFGGGQAELKLTNPDNMLESGVEIVAQPPGKKLQSVTLLSGGEKALTAVSLIFGIFSIKPSPFAVLDEVDAPLDDTNVGRFNTQVRNMSESSQIIVITHHKKTMEHADALYGVTMEEPGISKIASAKLGKI